MFHPFRAANRASLVMVLAALVVGLSGTGARAVESGTDRSREPFAVRDATVVGIHRALRAGDVACRDVVEASLARIAAYDDAGPRLAAVLAVNDAAVERAAELDERFAESGLQGSLHCVPVLLKDNFDTADLPTTAASVSLADSRPPDDATTVRKLREAGAVIVAKTNLHEFAVAGTTVSSLGGQTRNPYDLTRTPGGSSGGTGAGLAAGFGVLGTGTDTVNSIRSPASANSVVGLRPTAGLVSRDGIVPVSFTQDAAGPLARTVSDVAVMLDVLAGYDPADPLTAFSVGNIPGSYRDALDPYALEGARLGVFENFFGTDPAVHGEVNEVLERNLAQLRALGAETVPVRLPGVTVDGLIAELDVQRFEYEPNLNTYLRSFDAPKSSLAEIVRSGEYHPSVAGALTRALETEDGLNDPEYKDRLVGMERLRQDLADLMARHDLDALVYPHQKRLVVPIGEDQLGRNGALASLTGFPAISVPGGFSEPTESAPIGVPVGMELLGRPWSESKLLGYAYAFEQATHHRRPPQSTRPSDHSP